MFVYPADIARSAANGPRARRRHPLRPRPVARGPGPDLRADRPDRPRRPASGGRATPNVTLFEAHARFTDVRTLDTGTGETITADQVVIAAGSRPVIPDIEGLDTVGYHTSDTVMRLDELPERLLILGGGYVAAEFAHVFGSFGTRVTVVNRSGAMLRAGDDEISAAVHRDRPAAVGRPARRAGHQDRAVRRGGARAPLRRQHRRGRRGAGRRGPGLERRRPRPGPDRGRGGRRRA